MHNKLYACLFCFISSLTVSSQTLNFKQFTSQDGLPAQTAFNVFQDVQGYIWVSTVMGIVKHNGQKFIPACKNLSIQEHSIYSYFISPDKQIYFARNGSKIFKLQNDSAILVMSNNKFDGAMTDGVVQLIVDKKGDIYYSTFIQTFHYDKQKDTLISLSQDDSTAPLGIRIKQIDNSLLIIRDNFRRTNLSQPSPMKFETQGIEIIMPPLPATCRIQCFKVNNSLYFCDSRSIYQFSGNKLIKTKSVSGVIDIKPDPDGNLWLLTTTGAQILNKQLDSIATHLPHKLVNSVCFDRFGGIWATTIGSGTFYCHDKSEQKLYDPLDPQLNIEILSFGDDKLLFVTQNGDLFELENSKTKKIQHLTTSPVLIADIVENTDEYLIGTRNGLFSISKKTNNLTEIKDDKGDAVNLTVIFKVAPDTLLCRGSNSFILLSHNKVLNRYVSNTFVQTIIPHDQNYFLISNMYGIWKYDWRKNTYIPVDTSSTGNKSITRTAYDQYRNLWFNSELEGFFIRKPSGKIIQLKNCPFIAVYSISFYQNIVFVNTNMGVFKAHFSKNTFPENWIAIRNSPADQLGIQDNILYLTSEEGLLTYNLNGFNAQMKYPINIESIWCNGNAIEKTRSDFAYNENDLRFNIDFLNYQWPVDGFYFTLKGPTSLNGNITGNVLQVQNLAPGDYSLKIFPHSGNSYDKNFFIVKQFTIHPAYWQTLWFKLFLLVSIITLTALLVIIIYTRKRKRDAQAAEMNKLLAEHTLTALKAQINPHFISNSLSAIQALIDSGEIDKANQYIAKFSLLIRYVLKYSDKSLTRLVDELKIIDLNVELEQLRFTNSFTFSTQIANNVNINDLFIPPLITQPFIENAIWHGLLPMRNGKKPELILKLEERDSNLLISIIDNGIGRKKAAVGNTLSNNPYKESKGTVLIQERIHNLNQLYSGDGARVEINDLYDENTNSIGTHVVILLPLKMLNHLEEQQ